MLSDNAIRAMAEEIGSGAHMDYYDTLTDEAEVIIRRHLQAAKPDDRLTRAVGLLTRAQHRFEHAPHEYRPRKERCYACELSTEIDAFLASLPTPPHDEQTNKGDEHD